MENEVLISVIVPVYNAEKTIERCINSILNQKFKNVEILVINDGSTDRSSEVCLKYKERIRYFENINRGCSFTRNFGIKNSRGKYIAFVDSDDYIESDMYIKMYELAQKKNADLVVCGYYKIENNHKIKVLLKNQEKYDIRIFNSPCNKLYSSELVKENKVKFIENSHMGEDMAFNFQIYFFSKKTIYLNLPLYNYVNNIASVTNNYLKKEEIYFSIQEILNFIKINDSNLKFKKLFNDIYRKNIIELIFSTSENLKLIGNNYYKIMLKNLKKNMDINYEDLNSKTIYYYYFMKFRFKFYFLSQF